MNLTRYKLKISAFITFIILLLFFTSGSLFFLYTEKLELSEKNKILQTSKENIISLNKKKLKKLIENINNVSLLNIVSSALSEKNQTSNEIKKLIWVPFLYLEENKVTIFQNFDIQECNKKYICKAFTVNKYKFILAIPKSNQNIRVNILIFGIFAFFVSLLFFPVIFWIVWKLTKPVEENFEFMKNFINNAWHELKTPLANINLGAQILLQQNKFNKEIIQNIEKESKKLGFIIDTLLELSHINKFQQKQEINLKQLIEEIIWKYNLDLKNFNLDTKLDIVYLPVNKYQFQIMFENLLKNAIRHNNNKKQISITLTKDFLEIRNSTDKLPDFSKIFDLFYKEKSSWYWLGLTIVKKIVNTNKWKIKNISKEGSFGIKIEF